MKSLVAQFGHDDDRVQRVASDVEIIVAETKHFVK